MGVARTHHHDSFGLASDRIAAIDTKTEALLQFDNFHSPVCRQACRWGQSQPGDAMTESFSAVGLHPALCYLVHTATGGVWDSRAAPPADQLSRV
jgi:hypothetical protein